MVVHAVVVLGPGGVTLSKPLFAQVGCVKMSSPAMSKVNKILPGLGNHLFQPNLDKPEPKRFLPRINTN